MTNTQTPPPATTVVNTTGAPVATTTVANHAEKPEKFNGQNFKRWQQKMFFYLTTLGLARFLKETVPQVEPPAEGQSSNEQAVQAVEAWKHSEFLCRNYVLNGLVDSLYNVYCKTTTAKELWESLERKYKTEDAGSRSASWVEFKNYLKHKRKEMSVEDLVVRLRIEEDNKLAQKDTYPPDSAKANMVEHAGSSSRSNSKGKGKDKKKMKADGTIDKYKARLVIQGFRQREGLDYFDTYSPVTRITLIRTIIAIVALRNLEIHQMDVKTAFLNGDLEEEIYMNQPEGFIAPGQEGKVCRLVKSLYGLKQAPKQWHQKFDHTMLESGFKINECDKCVYVKDTSAGY
ncbi:pol polyprotein, partial [Tanacetum coccineum]